MSIARIDDRLVVNVRQRRDFDFRRLFETLRFARAPVLRALSEGFINAVDSGSAGISATLL